METGGPSAIEIILWILAANAILILSAFGMVAFFRQKSREAIHELGEQIQAYDTRLAQIASFLEAYSGIDQEPFSTPLDELQSEASEIQHRLQRFIEDSRTFEESMNTPGENKLQDIINAPVNGFRRWQFSASLREESKAIAGQLEGAEARAQQIVELPWELSTKCRQIDKDVEELTRYTQELKSKGARGQAFQAVVNHLPNLHRAIDEIPKEFLEAEHNDLLTTANLDSTIRVFDVLNRSCPVVARYLPQVREWHMQYQKANNDYAQLRQSGANLRQALAHPAEGLVIEPLLARLDHVAQRAAEANQRLNQPEVEEIKSLSREIAQLCKVVQDTEQQHTRAVAQLKDLTLALNELNHGIEKISAQFNQLANADTHPLVWDTSGTQLNALRQRLQEVGPIDRQRTPDQINEHLNEVNALRSSYTGLAETTPRTAEMHRSLLVLLESPELHEGAGWLRKSQEMLVQTAVYDPRNWPKHDSVQTLQTS
jgi:DNA repair exonuclease SbcCD ATPase subunit